MHSRFEMSLMGEMKLFLGLQIYQSPRGIFINHAKYALELLQKHGMDKCYSIGTLVATKPKLDADLGGLPVDQTRYRSMIGSLMYLTSSRPDLVQAYPEDSGFKLTAFSDADHAGCFDTRKSTSGGIQFLGEKLVSWMSKKQDCTAMSTAEAEYVALSASCAQVVWMRTQLKDYGFDYNIIPLTEYQLVDMFTKALSQDRFEYLVRRLDVDHAGCLDTRKSTSRGIQFLGDGLSWMEKGTGGGVKNEGKVLKSILKKSGSLSRNSVADVEVAAGNVAFVNTGSRPIGAAVHGNIDGKYKGVDVKPYKVRRNVSIKKNATVWEVTEIDFPTPIK
ncbi:retrovirus-related pol polyprotein from transposon TNT 1-94, partial [Tanacetum coccineum]